MRVAWSPRQVGRFALRHDEAKTWALEDELLHQEATSHEGGGVEGDLDLRRQKDVSLVASQDAKVLHSQKGWKQLELE